MRNLWLMYHDIHGGVGPDPAIPVTASQYHLSRSVFRGHLAVIRESGLSVCTASESVIAEPSARGEHVVITFDDGWAGSLTDGLECLEEAGFRSTFFVTRDYVGRRHYATVSQLRAASDAGHELGTHGCTHRLLGGCDDSEIRRELADSKAFLEDLTGKPVKTGSPPGGRWTPAVERIARECGYEALATSRPGVNHPGDNRFRLARMPIKDWMGPETITRYCRFSILRESLRYAVLELPKWVIGMERYTRIRQRLLEGLSFFGFSLMDLTVKRGDLLNELTLL